MVPVRSASFRLSLVKANASLSDGTKSACANFLGSTPATEARTFYCGGRVVGRQRLGPGFESQVTAEHSFGLGDPFFWWLRASAGRHLCRMLVLFKIASSYFGGGLQLGGQSVAL